MSSVSLGERYYYNFFGLGFASGEPIPGFPRTGGAADGIASRSASGIPIQIDFGAAPQRIQAPEYEDESVQASATEYLFHYPGNGRIHIQGSERIVVDWAPEADRRAMWQFVLGAGASVAGFRRGLVPIHASAVVAGDGCVAFAGQSTAGKSTIAALMTSLGYGLHADDLCLAQLVEGAFTVGRGLPELRLCRDSADLVGLAEREFPTAAPKSTFPMQTSDAADAMPRPLLGIYVLEFASASAEPGIYRLEGMAALEAVVDCLRIRLPLLLTGPAAGNFELLAQISRTVPVFRYVRPLDLSRSRASAESLAWHIHNLS